MHCYSHALKHYLDALTHADFNAVSDLLQQGCLIQVESHQWDALTLAIMSGVSKPFIELILSYPININHQAVGGNTPLILAVNRGDDYTDRMALLLAQKPNTNLTNSLGYTALDIARRTQCKGMASLLETHISQLEQQELDSVVQHPENNKKVISL